MAAAMTVCSPLEKPATAAKARPCWRASTTSTSAAIGRRSSSPTAARLFRFSFERAVLGPAMEERENFFEIQYGRGTFQSQAELHHYEGDVGVNAGDHRFGAAEPGRVGEEPPRAARDG